MKRLITTNFLVLASILLAACASSPEFNASEPARLTFVHLNDTYRIDAVEDGTRGGFGRVVTLLRQLRDEGRDLRILHGGDFLYPSLESQLWDGEQMIEAFNFMNAIAPMVVVAGNHEFDRRSPEQLIATVRASNFDWVGDNYRFDTGDPGVDAALRPAHIFEQAGRRVGVFSLTLAARDGGNDRDYVAVDPDYVDVARKTIRELEKAGVDLIIGVTHLHLADDLELAKLKSEHPKLAFIVGGHEHEPEFSPGSSTAAAVMKGASNARVIWQIDVRFDGEGMPIVEPEEVVIDETIARDPEYAEIPDKWRAQLLELYPFLEAPLGRAALRMDATEQTIRSQETAWGNFIADRMRGAFGRPQADIAFINSGTLRIDDYVAGDILFEDIARTFGFSSYLRVLPISGEEFRDLLEAGYRGKGPSKGYFPQVSGFRVCVDRRLPDFERIVSLQLPVAGGWAEIESDREYRLVMPDFLFRGGDGYEVPDARKVLASPPASELKYLVVDAIIRAQAGGRAVGEAVDPDNPRFVELGPDRKTCWPDL